jgi:hypothetical protein
MKFTIAATTLALAATALAAPSLNARTDPQPPTPPPSDICPNDNKQVCCNGILTCLVQVLGGPCDNDVFCCETDAPEVSIPWSLLAVHELGLQEGWHDAYQGAFINIALLNCVDIL